jgi:recombination protein RecA
MHALAETQKKNGVAVFIDTESSLDINFVRAIGVKAEELCYISCDHVEEIFDHLEKIVGKVRQDNKNKLVTVVVDSVAAASCITEMESDHGKDGYATTKAIVISKAMRKITQMIARQRICLIFTNQVRQNLGVTFGDKWTTSGGKALAFHSSIRIRMTKLSQIKHTNGRVLGFKSKAKVFKNRLGPPMVEAEFDLFFDRGMDNYGSWFTTVEVEKIATYAKTHEQKKKMWDKEMNSPNEKELNAMIDSAEQDSEQGRLTSAQALKNEIDTWD